jgi:hypothetical protein
MLLPICVIKLRMCYGTLIRAVCRRELPRLTCVAGQACCGTAAFSVQQEADSDKLPPMLIHVSLVEPGTLIHLSQRILVILQSAYTSVQM